MAKIESRRDTELNMKMYFFLRDWLTRLIRAIGIRNWWSINRMR
jgi:hypothetical protein